MLKPLHFAWLKKFFTKGTNSDIDPNLLGEGLYTDSFNMRNSSRDGSSGALKQIGGESLVFDNSSIPGASTYRCLGSCSIGGHMVSFWASSDPTNFPPLILVDGVLSAQSPLIPYVFNRPHQYAIVEDCKEAGVIYPADHNAPPLFWDVQDLINNNPANGNTQLYFSAFEIGLVSVGLNVPATIPYFNKIAISDLGGPIGLPVGQYAYSLRYVDPNGNRSNWGPETPLIPIPSQYDPNNIFPSSVYPGGRTLGGAANTLIQTQYGVNIEFRVDNQFGYSSIEVKRRRYNSGAGLSDAGTQELIARIPILPNQSNIVQFQDPTGVNLTPIEPIAPAEVVNSLEGINKPKAVEYADQRLTYANYEVDAQPIGLSFTSVLGKKMTAITRKLVRLVAGNEVPDGYDNPYNSAYFKSAGRGEGYGYGVELWNGAMGKFYAIDVPEPFTAGTNTMWYPNRGDIKGVDGAWGAGSETYSDDPIYGANVTLRSTGPGPVTPTFEITTQGTRAKDDVDSLINVSLGNQPENVRNLDVFNTFSSTVPPGVTITLAGLTPIAKPNDSGYEPWKPRFNQDPEDTYRVPPNTSRRISGAGNGAGNTWTAQVTNGNPAAAKGKVFAPTYHALGGLLNGVENIPSSAVIMSIPRTKPAGRVVAQGLGSYILSANSAAPADKNTAGVFVHFPDIAAGIIDQATIEDIQQNPLSHKMQVVAGRGLYNETYGYTAEEFTGFDPDGNAEVPPWCGPCTGAHLMDMVSYARIQRDSSTTGVNVGETFPGGMGYNPILGSPAPYDNYVGIDKWRRNGAMQGTDSGPSPGGDGYSVWQQAGQDGNTLLDIASFTPVSDGRSNYFRINSNSYLYTPSANTVSGATAFNDPLVRNFHQPFLVINIIKENAEVPEENSTSYVNTGVHIALRVCIGLFASEQDRFRLMDDYEFYNCSPFLLTDYRFLYIKSPNGEERRWVCVNIANTIYLNTAAIAADIALNGFWIAPDGLPVYGMYLSVLAVGSTDERVIRFDSAFGPLPDVGSRITVKYPEGTPIRVWGHDVTTAPSVHAIYDKTATRNTPEGLASGFAIGGLPLPYAGFGLNPRYFMPEKGTALEEQIYINYLISIRQWCIVWDAESRVLPALYVNENSTPGNREDQAQFFPAMHYIIRPYSDVVFAPGFNNFFPQYDSDYPDESLIFDKGGLRFLPQANLDYAKQPDVDFKGLPKSGYIDKVDRCTSLAPSNIFPPGQSDAPGLRTFLTSNVKTISEETGEIKVISSSSVGTQQNMYFWTQKGWGRILTDKRTIYSASGETIGTQSIDGYWGESAFLSRSKGLPDELWRLWSKGVAPAGEGYADTFFWPDREGVYRATGDRFVDISEEKWLKNLLPKLQSIGAGYDDNITAVYDSTNHEYLISLIAQPDIADPSSPYVFSARRSEWGGSYGHKFDKFLVHQGKLYGMRGLQTFLLDGPGLVQNGVTMTAFGEAVYAPAPGLVQEACAFRVHNSEPYRIEIYDKDHNLIFFTDFATQEAYEAGTGVDWVLNIDGWMQDVGRKNASIDPNEDRCQSELFYLRVIYQGTERATLTTAQLQLQQIV